MIVIAAATGEYGSLVVENLLQRVSPSEVAVAVRNPSKAKQWSDRGVDVRFADYDYPESLREAFYGADRLLFISSPVSDEARSRVDQHRRVVEAAADAGVGTIAYTSGIGADLVEYGVLGEHNATEQIISEVGLPHIFLRHPLYSDLFITPEVVRSALDAGEVSSNTGGRGLNTAFRADLAEAAAAVLSRDDVDQDLYEFTGPLWTYPQLAEVLAEVSGQPVRYRELEGDVADPLGLTQVIRSGGFEYQTGELEQVLGHSAISLRDAVTRVLTTTTA
jgi:NAD(P)H dehydrogenase (quinone)